MTTQKIFFSLIIILFTIATGLNITGCQSIPQTNEAIFDFFEYQGEDVIFETPIDSIYEYRNPIVCGFYPDPSICRKGEDYYMIHSSFSYYPGIPILHSRDLVHWEQIGHVLDRPSQLKLDNIRLSGGIYAPAISYNPANDTFYVVTTCVDGIGNFVVKTKDPQQGWSDPILLPEVGGIDPSLFFDEDGKAYLVHNDAPIGIPEYDGHRAIWIHNYDPGIDQTFGKKQVIVDGGVDKSKHPVWIEGPHLYKIKGKYYLMAAEGGTSVNHSEVIFTSDHVKGPYRPVSNNPILTQRDLPEDRANPITCTGHADLIETPDGQWFAIFLACRPYEGDLYHTGRETFLLPVTWKKGTPVIMEKGKAIPTVVRPENWKADVAGITPQTFTGNFIWRDDFNTDEKLALEWLFIRTPRENWWSIHEGKLHLTPAAFDIYTVGTPAFIGHRQQHTNFTVTTEMSFTPLNEQTFAGLVCYQNEKFNLIFGKTIREGKQVITVVRTDNGKQTTEGTFTLEDKRTDLPLYLRITGRGGKYSFTLSFDKKKWQEVVNDLDATILSTHKAGGFTGTIIGMYTGK